MMYDDEWEYYEEEIAGLDLEDQLDALSLADEPLFVACEICSVPFAETDGYTVASSEGEKAYCSRVCAMKREAEMAATAESAAAARPTLVLRGIL